MGAFVSLPLDLVEPGRLDEAETVEKRDLGLAAALVNLSAADRAKLAAMLLQGDDKAQR